MKKTVVSAIVFVSSGVFAASTGTLVLSGSVTPVNEITVTANANAAALNITTGETNKLVAAVSETSNNLNGYKINMRSASGSKLVHTIDSTKRTAYTLSYNGGPAVTLTTVDQQVKAVGSLTELTTSQSNVNVNVTAYPTAPAGAYNDTITISIVAN